jgi:hypothetical protein
MMDGDPRDGGPDEREAEEADGDAYPPGVPTPRDLPDIADVSEPTVISDTEVYEGELAAEGGRIDDGGRPNPLLDRDLLPGETDDPNVAAEEGLAWVPPSDPPTAGLEPDGDPLVAAGFGSTALDEPYDADHHPDALLDEGEMNARVREALRADAATTAYADRVAIAVVGDTAVLTGTVDDIDDADDIIAVAGRATGVAEVVDRLEVAAVDASRDPRGSEGA